MYLDEPGDYYTEAGEPIDVNLAKDAGFDIDRNAKQKLINKQVSDYKKDLESKLAGEEEALAMALSQKGKYDVRHVGGNQYALFTEDGVRVVPGTMSKAEIELLIGEEVPNLTGEEK